MGGTGAPPTYLDPLAILWYKFGTIYSCLYTDVEVLSGRIDGTPELDAAGNEQPTYDNDDIMDFSRVWTGHDRQPKRGGYENYDGAITANRNDIDPMQIKASRHDMFPSPPVRGRSGADDTQCSAHDPPWRRRMRRDGFTRRLPWGWLPPVRGAAASASPPSPHSAPAPCRPSPLHPAPPRRPSPPPAPPPCRPSTPPARQLGAA